MYRPGPLPAILFAVSLLAAALPAAAEGPTPGEEPVARGAGQAPAQAGPGVDAAARRAAAQEQMKKRQAQRLERWDANGDGKLDPDELAAEKQAVGKSLDQSQQRRAAAEAKRKARLAKYDRDGDGRLSDEERAAMRDELTAERSAAQKAKGAAGQKPKGAAGQKPTGAAGQTPTGAAGQ